MNSFSQLPFFLVLFFIGLTITTPATSQPQPQSCNDLSLLDCSNSDSSSNSKFQLPENSSLLNHVSGPNIKSSSQIDSDTAQVFNEEDDENSDNSQNSIIKVHGILSGLGWGILMPIGAMLARYMKAFEASRSYWFNFHRACQILAYSTGTTSIVLGLYLWITSEQLSVHGYIGFAIFSASTIQVVFALNYRPKEEDKKRIFWNILHYLFGYGVIGLTIFNMFKGFSISGSYHNNGTWKNAYLGIIVSLGFVALVLEVTTWFLVCKNRKKEEEAGEEEEDHENSNSHDHQEVP